MRNVGPHTSRKLCRLLSCAKLFIGLWVNIGQVIFLCNVSTGRSRQYWIGYFPAKTCLQALDQHCTSIFLCNFVPTCLIQHCIAYFPHKSCLLTMGQHCTGKNLMQWCPRQHCTATNPVQYCLNTLETTLHG